MREDEIVGWHKSEQVRGVCDIQGSLACCSPRGRIELDTTETELKVHGFLAARQSQDKNGKVEAVHGHCCQTRIHQSELEISSKTQQCYTSQARRCKLEPCSL